MRWLRLRVGGYIGESTARELAYAREHGRPVRFLESGGVHEHRQGGREDVHVQAERESGG